MTTITIDQTLGIENKHFATALDFVQSLNLATLLDFQEIDKDSLSSKAAKSLNRLESEGISDCVNL